MIDDEEGVAALDSHARYSHTPCSLRDYCEQRGIDVGSEEARLLHVVGLMHGT